MSLNDLSVRFYANYLPPPPQELSGDVRVPTFLKGGQCNMNQNSAVPPPTAIFLMYHN
jgi:hypothetical protein